MIVPVLVLTTIFIVTMIALAKVIIDSFFHFLSEANFC